MFRSVLLLLVMSGMMSCAQYSKKETVQSESVPTTMQEGKLFGRSPANVSTIYNNEIAMMSKDGRYVGYWQSAILDGSAFYSLSLRIIDMDSDKYVFRMNVIQEDYGPELSIEVQNNLKSGLLSMASKIIAKHQLKQVNEQPLIEVKTTKINDNVEQGTIGIKGRGHVVTLTSLDAKATHFTPSQAKFCEIIEFGPYQRLRTEVNGKVKEDQRIPKSRGCPISYRIGETFEVNGGRALMFIRVQTPGFEGFNSETITLPINP